MREEAERYCSLIANAESLDRDEFVTAITRSLADLVSAALQLHVVVPTDTDLPEGPSDAQWRERYVAVEGVLSDWCDYWTTMGAFGDAAAEAVNLPLADDLADIWRDLKPGLMGLETAADPNDVIWHWRFTFFAHWGTHAVEAMRALHAQLDGVR
jgi:Domain of unknown function (DUF5063)